MTFRPACPRCGDLNDEDASKCATCDKALLAPKKVPRYLTVLLPHHPAAQRSGRVRAHRLVAEAMLGRQLRPKEVVHHINGDTEDNRPENLIVFANAGDHTRHHAKLRREQAA